MKWKPVIFSYILELSTTALIENYSHVMKGLHITNKDCEFYCSDMKRYKINCLYSRLYFGTRGDAW